MAPASDQGPMGRIEFIALMAMMFATIAFSIDAMLPALDVMGEELSPSEPTRAALVISSFFLGMGVGTFFAGPLSDRFGRRNIVFWGAVLYSTSAAVAWASQSLEVMLVARFVQGIGASGPRIVCMAIIRDLYSGRDMARILSIVMMIFTLVPGFAPAMGAIITELAGWRAIYAAFIVFSVVSSVWLALRLPETLPREDRRPLRFQALTDAVRQMFAHPVVRLTILVQSLVMAILFAVLVMVQPIYAQVFDRAESFPYWFGGIALLSATSNVINATLVGRWGMRRLITIGLTLQILLSSTVAAISVFAAEPIFAVFVLWQAYVFFQVGLTVGNLNALAMEPMGHIAGTAASVIGAVSTLLAAVIASAVSFLSDGTIFPLIVSVLVIAVTAFGLMAYMARLEGPLAETP